MSVLLGDCLVLMGDIEDASVDMILCDLPYGTTACKWDTVIPFDKLWSHYKRVIKDDGAIVLTASQPFTSALVMSNPNMFRHEWIWQKNRGSNFAATKYSPMKEHESVLVFSKKKARYYPIMQERRGGGIGRSSRKYSETRFKDEIYGMNLAPQARNMKPLRYPSSIQRFNVDANNQFERKRFHPAQKPTELFEYLIKTYSKEGDMVLDNCAGAGTTGIACIRSHRDYMLIEKDPVYYNIALKRIGELDSQLHNQGTLTNKEKA